MRAKRWCLFGLFLVAGLVAWTVDDSVPTGPYVLRYPATFGGRFSIPANNLMTQEGVYLGRLLFYEPRLSATGTVSCGSCHQPARAFTDGRA